MRFDVVTLFPEFYSSFGVSQIWRRSQEAGLIEVNLHQLRDFTHDKHRSVDDVPYGGGPGMVMKIEPLVEALEEIPSNPGRFVLCASPQGRRLTQDWAAQLSQMSQLVLIAGRYEGVDERFVDGWVDESFSIGDYVLSGGDLPALVLMEAVTRLIPGVLNDEESVTTDSFTCGTLKFPQYTRPAIFRGRQVPKVLRSGDHKKICDWRKEQALERTRVRRPNLVKG